MINVAKRKSTRGYILLLNGLLFVSITFFLVAAIIAPVYATSQAATGSVRSTQSFLVANSAVEESMYRLKNGFTLHSSETLELGNATATILVSSGSDTKTIRVDSETDGFFRSIETNVSKGEGVSFNYGLQAGRGGFELGGGAVVNGNVYSNGNIIGSGGPRITGGATVASQSSPTADQSSTGPATPTNEIAFGGNATPQDFAQSFTVSTTTPVTAVRLYLKRTTTGWMNDVTLRIVTNKSGNQPNKTTLASANIDTYQVTTSYNYLSVPFDSTVSLTPGTTYWLVLDTSTTWGSNYAVAAASNSYADGIAKAGEWRSNNGGTWSAVSPSTLDSYFDIYVGGETGLIKGVTVGQNGGDVWAHEVTNVTANGTIYCQASNGNNKACNTSRPDPTEQPFPISDGNIQDWKDEATAGGVIVGNQTYGGADTAVIGPGKIEGDLNVGAGAVVTVAGTLYVTGDITVNGGASLRLALSYGSDPGVIVSDGNIKMSGGGTISGNGGSDSYVLVVTTSDCPDGPGCGSTSAVEVSGGTDSVILNAQQGTIKFTGGAIANQATAYKISMSGGTQINYLTGMADINFSSGPSGGWNVDSWSEI